MWECFENKVRGRVLRKRFVWECVEKKRKEEKEGVEKKGKGRRRALRTRGGEEEGVENKGRGGGGC